MPNLDAVDHRVGQELFHGPPGLGCGPLHGEPWEGEHVEACAFHLSQPFDPQEAQGLLDRLGLCVEDPGLELDLDLYLDGPSGPGLLPCCDGTTPPEESRGAGLKVSLPPQIIKRLQNSRACYELSSHMVHRGIPLSG